MTEGQIRGKWFWVQANGEFKITEFKLAGSRCMTYYIKIVWYGSQVKTCHHVQCTTILAKKVQRWEPLTEVKHDKKSFCMVFIMLYAVFFIGTQIETVPECLLLCIIFHERRESCDYS